MNAITRVGARLARLQATLVPTLHFASEQAAALAAAQKEVDGILTSLLAISHPKRRTICPPEFFTDAPAEAPPAMIDRACEQVRADWAEYLRGPEIMAFDTKVFHTVGDYCRYWLALEAEAATA